MVQTYMIGEQYRLSRLRKGDAVVRPAVWRNGKRPVIITSEPCCYGARNIAYESFAVEDDRHSGPWIEKCNDCGDYYEVSLVFTDSPTGRDVRLGGLVGVKWTVR